MGSSFRKRCHSVWSVQWVHTSKGRGPASAHSVLSTHLHYQLEQEIPMHALVSDNGTFVACFLYNTLRFACIHRLKTNIHFSQISVKLATSPHLVSSPVSRVLLTTTSWREVPLTVCHALTPPQRRYAQVRDYKHWVHVSFLTLLFRTNSNSNSGWTNCKYHTPPKECM